MDCNNPQEIVEAAKCFMCLTPDQREAVKTYLLAVLAGGTLDPQALLEEAKCFTCLQPNHQKAIQTSLLCQILNL